MGLFSECACARNTAEASITGWRHRELAPVRGSFDDTTWWPMVFLVVFRAGNTQAVTNAVEQAKTIADGYCVLVRGLDPTNATASGAMLIQSQRAGATALRNYLGSPLVQVVVVRVGQDWAAQGVADVSGWLQNVDALF